MRIFIERENSWREQSHAGTAAMLLKDLQINPQTVLIIKDDELVCEDEDLSDAQEIKIITVVSGG